MLHEIGCQGKVSLFILALLIGFAGKIADLKGPLQYLLRPLLGKNEFAVTQHMYAFIGPNLDNIH